MKKRLEIKDLLPIINEQEQGSAVYECATTCLWLLLDGGEKDTLKALVERGPVYDGDVPSKASRDMLIHYGLASRACFKGEQGYTVANYKGWEVYHALD